MVVGGLVMDKAPYLPVALESLLSQSYEDFVLLLLDDGSVDGTEDIIRRYAERDPRIHYRRNPQHLGTIANWQQAYTLGFELYPDAEYFCWATDHDIWHPRFLAALVAELDRHPEIVLAYPLNVRISKSGELLQLPWTFDTVGMRDLRRRLRAASRGMVAGDMIYGLFRKEPLGRAGIYRGVVGGDRLSLAEVCLYGEAKQVPEVLWYRRFRLDVSSSAQRQKFFPEGIPAYSYLPWWLQHAGAMAWSTAVKGVGRPQLGRRAGLRAAATYLQANAGNQLERKLRKQAGRVLRPAIQLRRLAIRLTRLSMALFTQALAHASGNSAMLPEPAHHADGRRGPILVNAPRRGPKPASAPPEGPAVRLLERLLRSPLVVGEPQRTAQRSSPISVELERARIDD